MLTVRPSRERGYDNKGWLETYHTFSFDTYYDPEYMGYRTLRVINEDRVKGGKGFGSHSHKDVEILTYVLEGALEHKDSLGNTSVIRPGEVQYMCAGTGVTHSEYNLSHQIPVHFIQIWIQPDRNGYEPAYTQKVFSTASKWGQWCLIASNNGRDGSIRIRQDVDFYSTLLDENEEITFDAFIDRYYWIQIVSGKFLIQETIMERGDAVQVDDEALIEVRCLEAGEVILFDLA